MPTHRRDSFALASALVLLFGCGGKTADGGTADSGAESPQDDPRAGDAGAESSRDASRAGDSASAPTGSELALATAACRAPHGALDSAMDADHVTSTLVRRWYMCSSSDTRVLPLTPIELAADGHWYRLAADAQGQFTRLQGIDNEGTWALGDNQGPVVNRTASGPITVVYRYTGNSMTGWGLAFEKDPVRFKGVVFTAGVEQWFVPIP